MRDKRNLSSNNVGEMASLESTPIPFSFWTGSESFRLMRLVSYPRGATEPYTDFDINAPSARSQRGVSRWAQHFSGESI